MIKAASVVELTPTSGEPGDLVGIEGTDFAGLTSFGVGLGPEVVVTGESPTVEDTGPGEYPRILSGYTEESPIKPGSFKWVVNIGAEIEYTDNGNGTLSSNVPGEFVGTINYTSGYFYRSSSSGVSWTIQSHKIDYTTYEFDVTPTGLRTNSSGMLSADFTVPDIWNGTEPVTVIDESGNVAVSDFAIYGSDVVPEPLTIGAIVLLSSAALIVSFYFMRKRSYTKGAL